MPWRAEEMFALDRRNERLFSLSEMRRLIMYMLVMLRSQKIEPNLIEQIITQAIL